MALLSCSRDSVHNADGVACFYRADTAWVNDQIAGMSRDDKIRQLVVLEMDTVSADVVTRIVKERRPGALVLQADSIDKQTWIAALAQEESATPLLFMCTAENGYLNFLKDAEPFPSPAGLRAVADSSLLRRMAGLTARHAGNLGIHATATPLVSTDNSTLSADAADSMAARGILPVCRLPEDSAARARLDSLIAKGLPILTARGSEQFVVPPAFDGLMIARMDTSHDVSAQVDHALQWGSDLIQSAGRFEEIVEAIDKTLSGPELDERVRKLLRAKAWCGLDDSARAEEIDGVRGMHFLETRLLSRQMFEAGVTLVKNEGRLLPLTKLYGNKIMIADVHATHAAFEDQALMYTDAVSRRYSPLSFHQLATDARGIHTLILIVDSLDQKDAVGLSSAVREIRKSARVIAVSMHPVPLDSVAAVAHAFVQLYGTSSLEQQLAAQLIFGGINAPGRLPFVVAKQPRGYGIINTPVTRLGYAMPEQVGVDGASLAMLDTIVWEAIANAATPGCQVLVAKDGKVILNKAYGYHNYSHSRPVRWDDVYDLASVTKVAATTLAAMKLVDQGKLDLDARLEKYFTDTRIDYTRIKADTTVLIDTINLHYVDDLNEQIRGRDTLHLNDSLIETRLTLISKVTPRLNIFKTRVRDLLLHKSGIAPSLPIIDFMRYRDSLHGLFNRFYCNEEDADFCVRVAENLYMRQDFLDSIWALTKQMRVYGEPVFQYSDANMVLAQRVIDSISGRSIDDFMRKTFYEPMGLRFTGYLPLKRMKKDRIVPTEVDRYWRYQTLQGDVHDPTAAVLGGVSGNAGLFSNALDLAVLFQMLLNGGTYGGARYLSASVVNMFIGKQPGGHRGLGFDMQAYKAICARSASPRTFGHTGFTGTCVWADPDNGIVFVFLSNRVHPSAKNWRLNSMKVRQRVHQAVYDALSTGQSGSDEPEV